MCGRDNKKGQLKTFIFTTVFTGFGVILHDIMCIVVNCLKK
ncbi:hypothetical protein AGMMS49950_10750 [Endomicrobiia bacterium]|nr:hypothetical protein AGMMS49950_10750 [Endomicrobiia bacterium]